jgi:hypothetical protein
MVSWPKCDTRKGAGEHLLSPAPMSSTGPRPPARKIPVRLPPLLPQDSVRQNARAQEKGSRSRQDYRWTTERASTALGQRLRHGWLRRFYHYGSFNTELSRSLLLDLLYGRLDHLGRSCSFYLS